MKSVLVCLLAVLIRPACLAQETAPSANQVEFNDFTEKLENRFIYYEDKKSIIACIKQAYGAAVDTLTRPYYKALFYEQLLNELYDSHVNLNTNTNESYRLSSPIYVQEKDGAFTVVNVFSQLQVDFPNLIDAKIRTFNGGPFQEALDQFPTICQDKNDPEIREWLANKILAGRRDQPRKLMLDLSDGNQYTLDMDRLNFRQEDGVLTSSIQDNIGYIKVNNSLGNYELVRSFDSALAEMENTTALVLDLRNTPDGGNTSVAEPIMGRFITEESGYQVCESKNETYTRLVYPSGKTYRQPLYVLVGRWTGSMGEGMAIGFDGLERGTVIGTEMKRLAGGMETINFTESSFGYRISFEKMYHLNGSLRETFVPTEYIDQKELTKDESLERALELIRVGK